MKLVLTDRGVGRLVGDAITIQWPDLAAWLAGVPASAGEVLDASTTALLAPSPRPEKVICVGLNYRRHAQEAGMPIPAVPVLFAKFANSVVAPDRAVAVPRAVTQLDYEAELAVVIGRTASEVPVERALDVVAGYCCANDLSARDLQFESGQWLRGKAVDGFLPLGPWLVTPDEVGDPQALHLWSTVNGDVRQRSSTADMIFSVAEIISFVSSTCTLVPGDVIITGTPAGVGMGFDPPRWLGPGDEVVVGIDGLGTLRTTVVAR